MIGILAGMGPLSTAPFIDLLMKGWQSEFKVKYDIDFPHVLIYSLPTPFYLDREINHQNMQETIKAGLLNLQRWGANFIAMPCNTAHRYFEQLQASLDIKLLDIIEATINKIPHKAYNITLLATETTMQSNLYQRQIIKANKHYTFHKSWQKLVNRLINVVKMNVDKNEINKLAQELIFEIEQHHIDCMIIGCTDISVIFEQMRLDDIVIIDSSKCLVDAIIDEIKMTNNNLKIN
ncbi:amino acid racemase [Thiotrichales bacterium 19S3-7]|nr:amino acid racemase [Thiotrichales bacterium 19S3-7]MCF6800612.1 amino acid racemase [Thiotrichales bacterium 19S3-11]